MCHVIYAWPFSIFGQNNSSNMSKLLEQLMQGGGGGEGGVIPVGLSNYADLCSGNQSLFGSSKSPEPGTLTPRSSSAAGETYDLSGMGKKVCALCNTFIANNPSSFDNHACKHLDYKPYYCYYCQYQSYIRGKVTRHIQQVHNGLPVKINHRPVPGIKDKIQTIKMKCFPFLVGGPDCGGPDYSFSSGKVSAGPPSLNETQCKLCEASVLSLESSMDEHLQIHIPVKGSSLNYDGPKYYHCPVCTYQTTYLIRAKQHVHSAHPTSQETRILCCPPDGLKGLQTLRIKCFGASVWSDGLMYEGETLKEESLTEMVDSNDVPLPVSTGEEEEDTSAEQMDTNTTESLGGRLVCGICKALVSNLPATIGSHVRNHLTDYKPYQCSYCIWKSGNEGDVKVHISSTHKNVPLRVLYNPERAELQRMQERCFPRFKGIAFSQEPLVNDSIMANGSISSTLLKKLVCQLCKNTIADNPKSVGIHVKNHLNYKPYRCPFCKYMSCEQSKARRHVEHVHSVSGDTVEIHAEDNIKERITEMKAKCFPSLVSDSTYIADSPEGFQQAIEDTATPPTRYNEDFQIREEWTQEEARYLPVEDRQDNATNPTNNSRDHP